MQNNNSFLNDLISHVEENEFWKRHLSSIAEDSLKNNLHLAVLVEPFLQYILDGKKTVESRFSRNRIAPFYQIKKNDVILLKRSGGPILGLCRADEIWFYNLEPESWKDIRRNFSVMLCAQDPEFWKSRKNASYATLIKLKDVAPIKPLSFKKHDRRGWVVLNLNNEQLKF